MTEQVEPSADSVEAERRPLRLEFNGTAREYFRVWIVNLCLTLFTFGIFSAWAKVRKKRYLYLHTTLDGSPFQYLGKPIPILKGRLVAATLAVVWYVVSHFLPERAWLLFIAALVLAPWVVVRSAAFNARYSAYRNMTFHFSGDYWGFAKGVYGWLLFTVVTFGVAFSWFRAKLTRYLISHTSFGGVSGVFRRSGGHFFGIYWVAGLLSGVLAALLVGVFALFHLWHFSGHPAHAAQKFILLAYASYLFGFIYLRARITNLLWAGIGLGSMRFESTLSVRALLWIYLTNTLAVFGSLGLLIPWAVIRTARYRAAHFVVWASPRLDEFEGSDLTAVRAAGAELGEFFDLDVAL